MYCIVGITNQHSHAYSSLYMSDFLFFYILNNELLYPCFEKSGEYIGLHLSLVLFIHLVYPSVLLSVLFCSLHKVIYITSATVGV